MGEDVGGGPLLIRLEDASTARVTDPCADVVAAIATELATRERWGCILPERLVRDAVPDWPPPADVRVPVELAPPTMWAAPRETLPAGAR
jgi:hypothetical protein